MAHTAHMLAARIAQSFETNEIWVKLRTGQDLDQFQGPDQS